MEFQEILRNRTSVRKFTPEQISPEELERILTAANMAPVGSRQYQDLHLTVVQDRTVLDRLATAAMKRAENKAVQEDIIINDADTGKKLSQRDPFYGAPTVIVVSHKKQDIQPGIEYANVACVTYAMHLAATDLGLGSVFMWFAFESMRALPEYDTSPLLGAPEGFEPLLGLAVGHAAQAARPRELQMDKLALNRL